MSSCLMSPLLRRLALALPLAAALAVPAFATDFSLTPVRLPDGSSISGTLSTDGSTGALSAAQITGWRVTVRQTQRWGFDTVTAAPVWTDQVSVSPDGAQLQVAASPDNVTPGGQLAFGQFGPLREYGVKVADFSGPYARGGQALYLAGAAWNSAPLRQPAGTQRVVANRDPANPLRYTLVPVRFPSGERLTGWITTDGSTGAIGPAQITGWDLRVQATQATTYFKDATGSNSTLLPNFGGVSTDGQTLSVMRPGGYLGMGVAPSRLSIGEGAVFADFASATAPPRGQAGWFDPTILDYKPLNFGGSQYPAGQALP